MSATDPGWVITSAKQIDTRSLGRRLVDEVPLVRQWAGRELRSVYRQSALDWAWSLVQPVVILLTYGLVLTASFNVDGDGLPYLSFAWAGLTVFTYFANALAVAVPSIVSAGGTVAKVYFPREVLPLGAVVAGLVHLGAAFVVLVALALVQGIDLSPTILGVLPGFVVLHVWVAGLGVWGAALDVFVRDVGHAIGLVLRVLFIASPIMYGPELLPEAFQWTRWANPLAVVTEATRDTVLRGEWPEWGLLAGQLALALVVFVLAVAYVRSVEARMSDVI